MTRTFLGLDLDRLEQAEAQPYRPQIKQKPAPEFRLGEPDLPHGPPFDGLFVDEATGLSIAKFESFFKKDWARLCALTFDPSLPDIMPRPMFPRTTFKDAPAMFPVPLIVAPKSKPKPRPVFVKPRGKGKLYKGSKAAKRAARIARRKHSGCG